MTALPHPRLGRSDLHVSRLSLGSWRTFERIPREDGVAVMVAARAAGIDFLDHARYDDETGRAPIPPDTRTETFAAGERRRALAAELDTTPAAPAIAFALRHPAVASVLLGATSAAQIAENVGALDVGGALDHAALARLRDREG